MVIYQCERHLSKLFNKNEAGVRKEMKKRRNQGMRRGRKKETKEEGKKESKERNKIKKEGYLIEIMTT